MIAAAQIYALRTMTKLTLLAAAAALLLVLSPSLAQEERQHQRRIPHRPDRPVSCNSSFFANQL